MDRSLEPRSCESTQVRLTEYDACMTAHREVVTRLVPVGWEDRIVLPIQSTIRGAERVEEVEAEIATTAEVIDFCGSDSTWGIHAAGGKLLR